MCEGDWSSAVCSSVLVPADLARHQQVRLAERAGARLPRAGIRVEAVGGDRELVVAAQRYPVLRAAHREQLVEERGLPEHEARARREAHHEPEGARPGAVPPELAQRRVPAALEVESLEIPRAAQDPAALGDADLVHRAGGRERQAERRVAPDLQTERGAPPTLAPQAGAAAAPAPEPSVAHSGASW